MWILGRKYIWKNIDSMMSESEDGIRIVHGEAEM
jgi:hypothetical protein